jgi:hypothetical protein
VVSYLLTLVVTNGAIDLTGALTTLLVMQASSYSTLKMGAVRVGAVLAGVLVATLLSIWIGLTWWSLGLAIAASLVLGRIFRLGEQALEAPISAMLILGVTNPNIAAEIRVLNTLIGAGVGVAFNLIYPPALPTRRAGRAMIDVAEATAAPLDSASQALTDGSHHPGTGTGLARSSTGRGSSPDVCHRHRRFVEGQPRFNPRALATTDIEPSWRAARHVGKLPVGNSRPLRVLLSEVPAEDKPDDRTVKNCAPRSLSFCTTSPIAYGRSAAWSSPR